MVSKGVWLLSPFELLRAFFCPKNIIIVDLVFLKKKSNGAADFLFIMVFYNNRYWPRLTSLVDVSVFSSHDYYCVAFFIQVRIVTAVLASTGERRGARLFCFGCWLVL